jgi:acyl carrier protein
MDRSEIVKLILETAEDVLMADHESFSERQQPPNEDTHLIGQNGLLSSMGLVNLILDVEQQVNDRYGVLISLVDERAMSQTHSPFGTVGRLADYILMLVAECEAK